MAVLVPRRAAIVHAHAPRISLAGLPRALLPHAARVTPRTRALVSRPPQLPAPGSLATRRMLCDLSDFGVRAALLPCLAALQPWASVPMAGPVAACVVGAAALLGLARAAHRRQAPRAYESRQFFLSTAQATAAAGNWDGALSLLHQALDPALPGAPVRMTGEWAAQAVSEGIARQRWEVAARLLLRVRLPWLAVLRACEQLTALGHPAGLPVSSVILSMEAPWGSAPVPPGRLLALCDFMEAHAPAEWLKSRAQAGWFVASLATARLAGRVGRTDGAWLLALHSAETQLGGDSLLQLAEALLTCEHAPMLRAGRALWEAAAAGDDRALRAAQAWAAVPAAAQGALAECVAGMVCGTQTEEALDEAFAAAGSTARHVDDASLRRAAAAWRAGDCAHAMQRVARLALSEGTGRPARCALLRDELGDLRPALSWCVEHEAWQALEVLLHVSPPQEALQVIDLFTERRARKGLPRLPLRTALFEVAGLDVQNMTLAQQETLAQLLLAQLRGRSPWSADVSFGEAFSAIIQHANASQARALLMALNESKRIPHFRHAMACMLSQAVDTMLALASDTTLSPRSLLLAAQALAAGGPELLRRPGCEQLLRNRYILKDETRFRRALAGFAELARAAPTARVKPLQALLDWPSRPALRELLADAVRSGWAQSMASVHALQGDAAGRAPARAAREDAGQAVALLALHARHVHEAGDATEVARHAHALGAVEQTLLEHGAQVGMWLDDADPEAAKLFASLADDSSPVAMERVRKQLGQCVYALGNRKHSAGKSRSTIQIECVELARAWVSALLALRRQYTALQAPLPTPARLVPFFARAEERQALASLHHRVLELQLDAMSWMADLDDMNKSLAFTAPTDLFDRLVRSMGLTAEQLPRFAELLASFRRPRLFWALSRRAAEAQGGEGIFKGLLTARLHSDEAYHAVRRAAPQMRTLFAAYPEREALRTAWEQGISIPGTGAFRDMSLCDTADFADFGSSGDEVNGSCHSLLVGNFAPLLLARMMDGSKRMLAIKDGHGAIKARAMLRLMQAEEGRPALLLSVLYTANADPQQAGPALVALAKQRAQALRLPLYGAAAIAQEGTPTTLSLTSQAAQVPEYWDELNAVASGTTQLQQVTRVV